MSLQSALHRTLTERWTDADTRAVALVAIALGALAVGYASGSVLAGESVIQQWWLIPTVTGVGVSLLTLHDEQSGEVTPE